MTYVSSAITYLKPLTPSMLLRGRSITVHPHQQISEDELNDPEYSHILNKIVRRLDLFIAHCWNRWKSEYLSNVGEAQQAYEKRKEHSNNGQTQSKVMDDNTLVRRDTAKRSV